MCQTVEIEDAALHVRKGSRHRQAAADTCRADEAVERTAGQVFAPVSSLAHRKRSDDEWAGGEWQRDFVTGHHDLAVDISVIRQRCENVGRVRWRVGAVQLCVASHRVRCPGHRAAQNWLGQREDVASGVPLGRILKVVKTRLREQAPGDVVKFLFEHQPGFVVFVPVEFVFVPLLQEVAIADVSHFAEQSHVVRQVVAMANQYPATVIVRWLQAVPSQTQVVPAVIIDVVPMKVAFVRTDHAEQILAVVRSFKSRSRSSAGVPVEQQAGGKLLRRVLSQ